MTKKYSTYEGIMITFIIKKEDISNNQQQILNTNITTTNKLTYNKKINKNIFFI